jgi:hypothetical protein
MRERWRDDAGTRREEATRLAAAADRCSLFVGYQNAALWAEKNGVDRRRVG